jgi:hypothetical protein
MYRLNGPNSSPFLRPEPPRPVTWPLTQVCFAIRAEILPLYYQTYPFAIPIDRLETWANTLCTVALNNLPMVRVIIPTEFRWGQSGWVNVLPIQNQLIAHPKIGIRLVQESLPGSFAERRLDFQVSNHRLPLLQGVSDRLHKIFMQAFVEPLAHLSYRNAILSGAVARSNLPLYNCNRGVHFICIAKEQYDDHHTVLSKFAEALPLNQYVFGISRSAASTIGVDPKMTYWITDSGNLIRCITRRNGRRGPLLWCGTEPIGKRCYERLSELAGLPPRWHLPPKKLLEEVGPKISELRLSP